jgi:glucokinase
VALSSLANTFDPDLIVLGGGVMAAGELLLDPAREELRARALPPMNAVDVVAAQLGPEAGMIGAATMARDELEAAA